MFSAQGRKAVRPKLVSRPGLTEAQYTQSLVVRILDGSSEEYHTLQELVRETDLLSSRPCFNLGVGLFERIT